MMGVETIAWAASRGVWHKLYCFWQCTCNNSKHQLEESYFRLKLHYFISQNDKMLLGREDILACVLSFLPPLPGSQVISRKWNETKMTNKISVSPDGGSGVVFLDPPGLGSIDGLPIDPQPGTNLPQPLLKHRDNHAI